MLRPVIKQSKEDSVFYDDLFKKWHPKAASEVRSAVTRALENSTEVYIAAVKYLAKYYIVSSPVLVEKLKSRRKADFWIFVQDSLFDMGLLCLCGLMDEGKDMKNLVKIQSCLPHLKSKGPYPVISDAALSTHERVHKQRDRRVAHPLRHKSVPKQYYGDPILLCNELLSYIQALHKHLYNGGFGDTMSLRSVVSNEVSGVCGAMLLEDYADTIRDEVLAYIDGVIDKGLSKQ